MKPVFSSLFFQQLNKTTIIVLLPLLLLLVACNKRVKENSILSNTASEKVNTGAAPEQMNFLADMSDLLTISVMNEDMDERSIAFRFFERQAIYRIDKTDRAYSNNIAMLGEALRNNLPVRFSYNPQTLVITNITKATQEEVRSYNTGSGPNSPSMKIKGADLVSVDVTKIDTGIFNRVDYQKWFPAFRLCKKVVPNYATLVNIFNYCASQGCNKPAVYTIPNCIPFQYVQDGCYARAHKMRQMITEKYGYCVEKVFSFAIGVPNTLAVKANMWGGCCVQWWYHVVPLLRVNIQAGGNTYQVCYVIDPGMFTVPVTLSTWLQAQKNTTCSVNATVTSYSIQAGSAYWPSFYGSTNSFATDPNYTMTEQTLINYKNGVTCY